VSVIHREAIDAMPQRYRAALINSLSGYKSAVLVATANSEQHTNLCIVSSTVHLGSNPPLLGFVMRPPVVPRDTYENILATGVYTLNHVHERMVQQAHQTSARYPSEVSEFDAVGLTAGWNSGFGAPYVVECQIVLGMKLVRDVHLPENDTRLIIGEVAWLSAPDECIADDGYLDLERAGTATISGLDSYHTTQRIARYVYAKPDRPLSKLT